MLKTAMIFGNRMILQRQKPIKVWGSGTQGRKVSGFLKGLSEAHCETQVDDDGNWLLIFSPLEAQRSIIMELTDGETTLTYTDVSIGDVWLAGGQSNMEYQLHYDAEKDRVLDGPMNPDIRFFDYPEVSYEDALEDYDFYRFGFWRPCTKEDLPYFSAVAYYFADTLQPSLDIPIGIVGCNWGGTVACAWMDPEYLKGNEGEIWLNEYEDAVKNIDIEKHKKDYRANPMNDRSDPLKPAKGMFGKFMFPGFSKSEQEELARFSSSSPAPAFLPAIGPYYQNRPGGLYETMLKKIAPYSLKGFIWYQGESDQAKASVYNVVFKQLIECWRDLWGDKLPFLFVQLAPFAKWLGENGENYPLLRQQQEIVSKSLEDVWMISSSDAGMEWDIHPKHKRPIGQRLALLAKGHVYGENILCDAPEFVEAFREENGIRIRFTTAEGLYIQGSDLNALHLTDNNGDEVTAEAIAIDGESLLLKGHFPSMLTISFARTPYYEVNLYNKENNPAKPLQTIVQ